MVYSLEKGVFGKRMMWTDLPPQDGGLKTFTRLPVPIGSLYCAWSY